MAYKDERVAVMAKGFSSARSDYDELTVVGGVGLNNDEKALAQELPVHALSPELHLRQGGTDAAHVQLLIDASGHSELPPILVQKDGWRIIDGLHRLEAAKLRGDHSIRARFVDCTDAEALVLAMKANSSHGLPLSKADRVSGAKRVLAAHPDWSDRAIAGLTGLSGKTIASLRDRSPGEERAGGKRLGRDGKLRSVTAGEGRRRAAEYISAHPDATLREVARETDVSLGTVHDVSARLRRGVSPERNGHRAPGARLTVHAADRSAAAASVAESVTAPDTGGAPSRRRNHTDVPPAWAAVAAKVANDPCVRYTEGGKEFLQWMALHATDPDGWQELVNAVPPHWRSVIAPIAESISEEWSLFAERLRSRP